MNKTNDNFIMLPTVDFCFKELMNNPKVRKGFIAAALKISPKDIKDTYLLPTALGRHTVDDKLGILDVHVLMQDGAHIDMEMQVAYFVDWDKRVLFYLGKMFTDQLKQGDSYSKLKKCMHISILDFVHFRDNKDCYHVIKFCNERTGQVYTDLLEIQILELKKLPQDVENGEDIIQWMKFFSGKSREEFENMAKTNEYLDEAYKTLIKLSADEQKRLEYEAREKALRDYNSQMENAEKRGIMIGEDRGKKMGVVIAKKVFQLHMLGKTKEEIAEECDISIEEVTEILE